MTPEPYRKKPGDMEIRILKDGRVIFAAPDESLMDVAQAVDGENSAMRERARMREMQHGEGELEDKGMTRKTTGCEG